MMRRIREQAYGEDIGQHSWVSSDELRGDAKRLRLTPLSRLLDMGSGPCGPLTFLLRHCGCRGVGLELSASALRIGRERAAELGVEGRFDACVADLDDAWPADLGRFDAVLGIDVVLHVKDRLTLFDNVRRSLEPQGRFLFTDAGVLTGAISNEEIRRRSAHGFTQFVPEGWNERLVERAGFKLIEQEDRTQSVVRTARGRIRALQAHREALDHLLGIQSFDAQIEYLETVAELAERGALSRKMFLAHIAV